MGGWCVGADLALNLQEKLDGRGIPVAVVFGLDANLDFSDRKLCSNAGKIVVKTCGDSLQK